MTITTIVVTNLSAPIEVQNWLIANPNVIIKQMFVQDNLFYVLY